MILVTGSSGLVGSAVMKLGKNVTPVKSSDFDLRDYSQVCNMFEKYPNVNGVIHLAANVGGIFKNMKYPVEMFEDNIIMNTNVLKAAHKYNINRVLCCLSTCIFPDKVHEFPITVDVLHDGPPHPSNEGYAYSKRMMEVHCRMYQKEYGREYFCVVPTNVYGPHDNFGDENSHVIPALIKKFCECSTTVVVKGDGTPLRQFVYSEDFARMILWAFENYKNIDIPLIVCPPDSEMSISDIVSTICEETGFKGSVVFEGDETSNGQRRKTVTYTIWPDEIQPPTNFREGIRNTIQWYRSQPFHEQVHQNSS